MFTRKFLNRQRILRNMRIKELIGVGKSFQMIELEEEGIELCQN